MVKRIQIFILNSVRNLPANGRFRILALCLSLSFLSGCSLLYYKAMEKLGKEKRDILVSRILDSKKDQQAAEKQLKTTMEAFQELTGFQGGDLQRKYEKLNDELESAKDKSRHLSDRIKSIDSVSADLFKEWQKEINQMRNAQLKFESRNLLQQAKTRQANFMKAMYRTESKIKPVLRAFEDQVLFLKHNLNARAIGSLKTTANQMNADLAELMKQIEVSMKEADTAIDALKSAST